MAHVSDLISEDILAYLKAHEQKSMLRFITCGSVDDGKSTLIGRLLYESQMLFEDHLAALESDSQAVGTQGDDLDFALLLDGLAAEREQGITIDVAYRYFSTDRRKFIVADTPGHEQYTRNMITGASTADCAVILIDARKGVLTQTRRHSYLVSLIGIRHVVAGGQQDGPRRLLGGALPRDRGGLPRVRRRDRHRGRHVHPAVRPDGRERRRAERRDALVRRADADRATSRRSRSTTSACSSRRSACPCSG